MVSSLILSNSDPMVCSAWMSSLSSRHENNFEKNIYFPNISKFYFLKFAYVSK